MIKNAYLTIAESEITLSAKFNEENNQFVVSLSQDNTILTTETFDPEDFEEFVEGFQSTFCIGTATVEIRNRLTCNVYRRYLRDVLKHYRQLCDTNTANAKGANCTSNIPTCVTGVVARVSLDGVLDMNALKLDHNSQATPNYELVPGPTKPLRVGHDDLLIQNYAQDNMFELDNEPAMGNRFYVACLECPVIPLTLAAGVPMPKLEFRPNALICTNSMKSAIQQFETEHGKRLWLPLSNTDNRFEQQLGISRLNGDPSVSKVMIRRMRKDCVLGEVR